jgi:hypothetical protein
MKPRILIAAIFLLFSCSQGNLENTRWILRNVQHNGRDVKIRALDAINLQYKGQDLAVMNFGEDQRIQLPGLNSPNIEGFWAIRGKYLYFGMDSSEYDLYGYKNADLEFLGSTDSTLDVEEDIEPGATTELKTDSGKITIAGVLPRDEPDYRPFIAKAMKVYDGEFSMTVYGDTLVLRSDDSKLTLIRVHK